MSINLQSLARYLYTVVLRPKPARAAANAFLRMVVPPQITVRGVRVALNQHDPVVSGALTLRVYERFETELLAKEIRPGMTVLDIGGNVGYFTALFASWVGRAGRVLVFEPEPESLCHLRRTIALNGFSNVDLYPCAVAEYTGRATLYLSEVNRGDHRLAPVRDAQPIEVNVIDLDSLIVDQLQLPVDFIKMDIQGAEALAVAGMQRLLQVNQQVRLFAEFWPDGIRATAMSPVELLTTIADLGFAIFNANESTQQLEPIKDFGAFVEAHPGRKYTNILCYRQDDRRSQSC